jgi:formate--tetrahydrofolate ligase
MAFPSDLEIARGAALKPLEDIADEMGIPEHLLEPHGEEVMKIKLDAIAELADRPAARYVVVSAITPTPLGEGKTTTTVGLGQGLRHIGKRATVAIRQPSMGPTFGIKGGAAGGGYSQVVPMEALNLHLTGDMHAVTAAHNLLAGTERPSPLSNWPQPARWRSCCVTPSSRTCSRRWRTPRCWSTPARSGTSRPGTRP